MAEQDSGTKERLLQSGKEEFLQHGFQNASLRRICANAGVTTGALYFFFRNKEDLFGSIVGKPLAAYHELIERSAKKEIEDVSSATGNEENLMRLLMTYREEFILLLEKSAGTKYENCLTEYKANLEKVTAAFFEKYAPGKANGRLIQLIVSMRVQGYLEIIHGNDTLEEAMKLAKYISCYAEAGFSELTRQFNHEC